VQHPDTVIVYPVSDLARAKDSFTAALGAEPYADSPYYVGFRVGGVEVGLDPNGHASGNSGPTVYHTVDDINAALASLVSHGASVKSEPRDPGGGQLIAVAVDADGNAIGLSQAPSA
jgi:predicted enzyme related to lactoylglutathione lyase